MQYPSTILLRGGIDTESPPIGAPTGSLSFCENYEPDVAGYTRFKGYERFDGRDKPSEAPDAATRESRRAAIGAVPGTGSVLAVWPVTDSAGLNVYAIRQNSGNTEATIYKASGSGWVAIARNSILYFTTGKGETVVEGDWGRGTTNTGTTFKVERIIHFSGTYSGDDAAGYYVLSNYAGGEIDESELLEFASDSGFSSPYAEAARSSVASGVRPSDAGQFGINANGTHIENGSADPNDYIVGGQPILEVLGEVNVRTHNFLAGSNSERSYITTGSPWAFEFDGEVLCPIRTDQLAGSTYSDWSRYTKLGIYREHLFLGTSAGTVINSAPNDPLDFKAISGASESGFGTTIVGFQDEVFSALIIYGDDRVSYLTGSSSTDFTIESILKDVTPRALTMQLAGGPIFMDRVGVRRLVPVESFGNWRVGTLTAQYETFFRRAFASGTTPTASMRVNERDIYRLFFNDGTAISVYFGRKSVEIGRLRLPITVTTASGASSAETDGLRFVGASDGYVYQMDVGDSMDGDPIQATITVNPYSPGSPRQNKRFVSADLETDGAQISSVKFRAEYDYSAATQLRSSVGPMAVNAGGGLWGAVHWSDFVWSGSTIGTAIARLDGKGRNVLLSITTVSDFEGPHTLTALTFNCINRGVVRR